MCFLALKQQASFFKSTKQSNKLLKSQYTSTLKQNETIYKIKRNKNIASEMKTNKNYMLFKLTFLQKFKSNNKLI